MAVNRAVQAVTGMQLNVTDLHVLEGTNSSFTIDDLPIRADLAATTTHVQSILEYHAQCDMVSFDDVLRNITDGTVLPEPFCLPDGIPAHECQMFLFPSGPEQFSLLKFLPFKNRTGSPPGSLAGVWHGHVLGPAEAAITEDHTDGVAAHVDQPGRPVSCQPRACRR
eukprot:6478590-Amphidinium_carterae.2